MDVSTRIYNAPSNHGIVVRNVDASLFMYTRALEILQRAYGPDAIFRDGQWDAIESVMRGEKTLVVQQTGWGKSVVYFVATKLRREAGHGPTLLISPLLSLARNQILSARRFGLNAIALNSSDSENRKAHLTAIKQNQVDIILITPEQLAQTTQNTDFSFCRFGTPLPTGAL